MNKVAVVKGLLAGIGLGVLSSPVLANEFGIGINNDTAELSVSAPVAISGQLSGNYLEVEDQGEVLEVGFLTLHHNSSGTRTTGLGVKMVKLWSDHRENGHAGSIGFEYRMPVMPALDLELSAYYGPSVLASSGVDRFYRVDAKLLYALMPTGDVFVGYRDLEFKFDHQPDQTLDQSFFVGAEFKF